LTGDLLTLLSSRHIPAEETVEGWILLSATGDFAPSPQIRVVVVDSDGTQKLEFDPRKPPVNESSIWARFHLTPADFEPTGAQQLSPYKINTFKQMEKGA
jgi:hypothetical protein